MAPISLDPATIEAYVQLAVQLEEIAASWISKLRSAGVTDEQIAAIRADLATRIDRSAAAE
jgi:hypothetical protein